MDTISRNLINYFHRLARETADIAQSLDGTGWVLVSAALLICGWFFLKGNKIKST